MLSGLEVRSDLNGKYGVVTALDMTRLRAGVKIEGSGEQNQEHVKEHKQEQVMCKFSNLTVVEAAGGGGAKASEQAKVKAKAKTTGNNSGAAGGGGLGGGGGGAKALELCDISDVCARPQCQATSCRFKCSRCELVWYCKAECQSLDWAFHKVKCKTKQKRAEEKAAGMALVMGSLQGRLTLVRSMLERGADVNFVNDEGLTALLCASQRGTWR